MKEYLPDNWKKLIPSSFQQKPAAARASIGLVFNSVAEQLNSFMVGMADLSPSVNMIWEYKVNFQNVGSRG